MVVFSWDIFVDDVGQGVEFALGRSEGEGDVRARWRGDGGRCGLTRTLRECELGDGLLWMVVRSGVRGCWINLRGRNDG